MKKQFAMSFSRPALKLMIFEDYSMVRKASVAITKISTLSDSSFCISSAF